MRAVASITMILLLTALPTARAETATPAEARAVAENYVQVVIHRFGSWGGQPQAKVGRMRQLRRGPLLLAYVFDVDPDGFMVVSYHKEIAAVKLHSATGRFDPDAQHGMVAWIRDELDRTVLAVQAAARKPIEQVRPADWERGRVKHYREAWSALLSPTFDAHVQVQPLSGGTGPGMDYREGQILISSHWYQSPPFNDQCPDLGCDWSGWPYNGYNTNALVGCVATAGAQIMHYWNWPPCNAAGQYVDAYRWSSMPDTLNIHSPQHQIDCVAAAMRSVGNSVGMNYGCSGSSAATEQMEQVYENRRYHETTGVAERSSFSDVDWFERCKSQCNENQPAQYRVPGHSLVMNGWYELWLNNTLQERWLHMNLGWFDGNNNAWYLLNTWPLYDRDKEFMVRRIRPSVSLGTTLSGYYARPSGGINHFDKPTRYFNRDASGVNAEFQAGHSFQYLRPGVWIRNTGGPADSIQFHGSAGYASEFYHRAPFGDVKIRILDGTIKLQGGGEMCLH